jgi:dynein heavy chain 1
VLFFDLEFFTPLRALMLVQAIRPERVLEALSLFLKSIFDTHIPLSTQENRLQYVVDHQGNSEKLTPTILWTDKGLDVTNRVENLAVTSQKNLLSVAMGSSESLQSADAAISQAIRTGSWVLIKNAHLQPEWLQSFEKRLNTLVTSATKLFITLEHGRGIPLSLLRLSRIVVFEPASGMRATILDQLLSIPKSIAASGPSEKFRVLFVLAWMHSIIVERLRYVPVGWSKQYDINDSDFEMSINIVHEWMRKTSNGKSNVAPEKIPWTALQRLLVDTVYGGRIEKPNDLKILDCIVSSLMTSSMFDNQFSFFGDVQLPSCISLDEFIEWARELNDNDRTRCLGLPMNADMLLKKSHGIDS